MMPQKGSSLLKSCARRSFFLRAVIYKPSRPIRIVLATHDLRNTALAYSRKVYFMYIFCVIIAMLAVTIAMAILEMQLCKSKSSTAFLDNKILQDQTNNLVLKKRCINL